MALPWLHIQRNIINNQPYPVLYENTSLFYAFQKTRRLLLEVGESSPIDTLGSSKLPGVWLKRLDDLTTIAKYRPHYNGEERWSPAPEGFTSHQLAHHLGQDHDQIMSQICGKILVPFSIAIILFADSLGGLQPTVELLARLLKPDPVAHFQSCPRLLVVLRGTPCDERVLERLITAEISCVFRKCHPESPLSESDALQMWSSRVDRLQVISDEPSEIAIAMKEISLSWKKQGSDYSAVNFHKLMQRAINWFCQGQGEAFNILDGLCIRDPVTKHAKAYLEEFLNRKARDGFDYLAIAVSCLAYHIYTLNVSGL
ncbi:hypothetical protein B0T10DRAFT_463623 [Thelonectria olida]|uniref:Uncharacterized protein n=1 Tax=Thelonectria olida TaxID=1576542 RepID=A0A9P8VWR9_9HYPO|nr:hypothetical protein B0T10DRAFT_463623 [Thelonectria olida]